MKFLLLVLLILFPKLIAPSAEHRNIPLNQNLTDHVNPFIGTTGGLVFPGATSPFGMVAWSPDTSSYPYSGGYHYYDKIIRDFSLTHFSGGGLGTSQQIPIMPISIPLVESPSTASSNYYSEFDHINEHAEPGYYKVFLESFDILVELTATTRTGFGRFTFPKTKISTFLINKNGSGLSKKPENGSVYIHEDGSITGHSEQKFYNRSEKVYFYIVFDKPFTSFGVWDKDRLTERASFISGDETGGFVTFDTTENQIVQMKVGISFVSVENAKENLTTENPGWNFHNVKRDTSNKWNEKLNKINIHGGTTDEKTVFYTALYHVFMHPSVFSDTNGQYIGFDNEIHQIEDNRIQYHYFAGWDMYRTQIQLLSILEPSIASDMIQSMVNMAKHGNGHLPIWGALNNDYKIMRGDNGVPVVASAYAFGARNFDKASALSAMINGKSKRFRYQEYSELGYVPSEKDPYSASTSLEYFTDDFSLAAFAKELGKIDTCKTELANSMNWKKLFNYESGHIQPKKNDGSWLPNFEASERDGFQEANSEVYSWMIPYDIQSLVDLIGGGDAASKRLLNDLRKNKPLVNQPSFISPWLFNYMSKAHLTQKTIKEYRKFFTNTPEGLPGNDDGGSTSSWYIFAAMGIYPLVPGIGGFTVTSPQFDSIYIHLENGKIITIHAKGAGDKSYINKLLVNGSSHQDPWLDWNRLKNGGSIIYELSDTPKKWGNFQILKQGDFNDLCEKQSTPIKFYFDNFHHSLLN